ncbi:MAG TPA: hypothetical protein VGJ22_11295 [Anaerolineales bacterium]
MRSTVLFGLFVGLFVVLASFAAQAAFGRAYPRPPGPSLDEAVGRLYKREIDVRRPEIVLLGDSVLKKAVDEDQFQAQLQRSVYKLDIPGSSSALWYLILKHEIVESDSPPRYLVVLFRDTMLTVPDFRVGGPYLGQIDKFAAPDDSLFLQLSFLDKMTPLELALDSYLPVYSFRTQIRSALDGALRHSAPALLGCAADCADDAVLSVISGGNLDADELETATIQAEQVLYTPQQLDFEKQVQHSFLPEMIRLARERGIQPIFVRAPTNVFPRPQMEPAALQDYMDSLDAYLAEKSIPLLDLSKIEQIGPQHFVDPLHMSAEGKTIFTGILADALKEFIK